MRLPPGGCELAGGWRAAPADETLRRAFSTPEFDDRDWGPITVPGHWRSEGAFAASDGPVLYRRSFRVATPAPGRRAWLTFDGVFYDGDVWLDGSYLGTTEGYFFPHTFEVTDSLGPGHGPRAGRGSSRAHRPNEGSPPALPDVGPEHARPNEGSPPALPDERTLADEGPERVSGDGDAEHVLAVEVGCAQPSDRAHKRALTGVFGHWDCLDPAWSPGGIWRPVRLTETGPVRLARLRALCSEASAERAVLEIRAVLDASTATRALLRITVAAPGGSTAAPSPTAASATASSVTASSATASSATASVIVASSTTAHNLAHGENRIRLRVPVERPDLWWPHALGHQPLHRVTVEALVPADGAAVPRPGRRARGREEAVGADEVSGHVTSDSRALDVGLRQVRMSNWILTVNGERLFVKGANHGPTRMALAEATAAELERDVVLAIEAGLDLLRVHAHVTRPELYDAADRHGLLLWQDLPLQWGYARTVRRQAVRQAREAVDLLGHHASIAVWCAHNEPLALDIEPGAEAIPARIKAGFAARQALPTWNKTVLDTSVGRALERADPTRPVVPHSGVLPGPVSRGTDTHLYCGWYHGGERDIVRILAAFPRLARFVTEFGAQAVPETAAWMAPESWPDLDWEDLGRHHSLQLANFERYVPPAEHATFDSWRSATQQYQATLLRHHVETLRRLKYRPTGGFCQFCLADGHPAVTWSVLDHERVPKAGYHALAAACAPVIVVAERPAESYSPGAPIELDVHVVSDLRRALGAVRVVATLAWSGGSTVTGWEGDVPADSCVRVGALSVRAPAKPGRLCLALHLSAGDVTATNTYLSEVAPRP